MDNLNTLYIGKADSEGVVKDSLADFGMACGEIPFLAQIEAKDLGTLDCPGENGERSFFPDRLSFKAYDIDVPFLYYGKLGEVYDNYKRFRDYLSGYDGTGSELIIFAPWCGIGRSEVNVSAIKDLRYHRDEDTDYLGFAVTFHIANPIGDVVPLYSSDGEIIKLIAE